MGDSGSIGRHVHGTRRLPGQSAPAVRSRTPRTTTAGGDQTLRNAIVSACLEMSRIGLNQGRSGNVSARSGADMLITPSAVDYAVLRPDMILRVGLAEEERPRLGPYRASSEWRMHRDILRARPDVGAIVHCHSTHATALAMLRRPLPAVHYMIALFGGSDVRCAPYAPFGSQELSDLAVEALAGRTAALLGSHGALALGVDLAQAMRNAHELETLARMYLIASTAGEPALLSEAQIEDAIQRFADYQRSRRGHPSGRRLNRLPCRGGSNPQ